MLLLTLPGTPILYAGDEIGMRGAPIPPKRVRDPFERLAPGYGLNRDPERAPMRWDPRPNAGFTTGEPWLPIGDDIAECNVAAQREDGRSLLALYRRLIALRGGEPVALARAGEVRLSTHLDRWGERVDRAVRLRPHEGIIIAEIGERRA